MSYSEIIHQNPLSKQLFCRYDINQDKNVDTDIQMKNQNLNVALFNDLLLTYCDQVHLNIKKFNHYSVLDLIDYLAVKAR